MKVLGAEEVLTECNENTDLKVLETELKSKLNTDVKVFKENNEVIVTRLLID